MSMQISSKSLAAIFFLHLFVLTHSFGQSAIEKLPELILNYNQAFPWEKVYLHTDKPQYYSKDTIWIKAYGILEKEEKTANTSSVPLYVELIDPKFQRIAAEITIKMDQGNGRGDLVITEDLTPGPYTLRAYTNYMKNFGGEAVFHKDIWIRDFIPGQSLGYTEGSDLQLSFFPEGGVLVDGIKSKIGIKASEPGAKGIASFGYLFNSKMDTLLRFETNPMGVGSLSFVPQINETYEIRAKTKKGPWQKFRLAAIQATGFVMEVDPLSNIENINITIQHNSGDTRDLFLIGMSKGGLVYQKQMDAKRNQQVSIPKDDFLPGLVSFYLMDTETNILAQRLVMLHPFSNGIGNFLTDKSSYQTKDTVELEVEITDEFGRGLPGDFSVSVLDSYQVISSLKEDNIFTNFHLSSETSSEIENPFHYFDPENPHSARDLDDLLLTQRWRRFSWENLRLLDNRSVHYIEEGLSLSGNLSGMKKDNSHRLALLINPFSGEPIFHEGDTDPEGNFSFRGLEYYDSVGVFLQAYIPIEKGKNTWKVLKKHEVNLSKVEKPVLENRTFATLPTIFYYTDDDAYLVKVKKVNDMLDQMRKFRDIELGEVTVTGRRSNLVPDKRAEFYQNSPYTSLEITEEMHAYQNIFHFLKTKLGYKVIGDEFSLSPPPILTLRSGSLNTGGVRFIIDGKPTFNNLLAASLPLHQIERIDILRGPNVPSIYGANSEGVINVLTKSGNPNPDFSKLAITGNATMVAKGYVPVRDFYIGPDPEVPLGMDYRSTLYWNPEIRTDANGKAKIIFQLSDGDSEVWVRLEGLSDAGEPVFVMHKIKVGEK